MNIPFIYKYQPKTLEEFYIKLDCEHTYTLLVRK